MSDIISWNLQVAIHPGKIDDFRAVVADLIAATENEAGTLAYEWNLSADGTTCDIYERYRNSEAIAVHLHSFAKFAARFLESCHPASFHVYGSPSEEVKSHLSDLKPLYLTSIGGFHR